MTTAPQRLTGWRLERLSENLTTREREILEVLATVQVMTTAQLARVVFAAEDEDTAARSARRHLQRLRQSGLVRALTGPVAGQKERRIWPRPCLDRRRAAAE